MDKEKPPSKMEIELVIVLTVLIIAALITFGFFKITFFATIIDFITSHTDVATTPLQFIFRWLVALSFPVSVMLLIGIILSVERLKKIRKKEHAIYNPHVEPSYVPTPAAGAKGSVETTNRWKKILKYVDSDNQNDWRQAIIEADIILDEMLTKMSYHGEDLGGKLRGATKADFQTLDQAWEGHKVRNMIAHDGGNFALSQHEAKRVINLYRQVFEEFFYI